MPPGLARDDIGLADRVQKRGLAVVDMAHDRDDRRARLQVLGLVLDGVDHVLDVGIGHALHRWPNSSTISSAVSASMDWFCVTIMPFFISALTTSATRSAMRLASSETTIVSGT
jgi:hypothetical protein